MIHKIMYKLVSIDFNEFFGLSDYQCTRGHNIKLIKPICCNNARQFSFACRRIDAWNFLPESIVNTQSVISFKRVLKFVDFNKFLLIK
jgi:hypothetical protein